MPLRILIHSLSYAPEQTGIGKYSGDMGAWFASRGHEVHAIAGVPHYPEWRVHDGYRGSRYLREEIEGVRVLRAPHFVPDSTSVNAKTRIALETSFSASGSRYWLPRLLFQRRYDVVIAVCPPLQALVYPALYASLRRTPWVAHIQDFQVDAAVRLGLLDGRLSSALYGVEGWLLRRASAVSTITEAMRRRCVDKGVAEEKTLVFPNWADVDFVQPAERDNAFRHELGYDHDDVICLYAGNMGEKQGLELILEVANRMRDRTNVKFVLVGNGASRARLKRQASEMNLANLQFVDLQPWARVPEMLAAGDVHLIVQKEEAADLVMPSKLTNTLAAGRCVVATASEGTALYQVVAECGVGVACPPESADDLYDAVIELTSDSKRRVTMGHAARDYAEKHLEKNAILERFERDLYALAQRSPDATG